MRRAEVCVGGQGGRASRIISEIEGEHRDGNGRVGESSGGFVFIHLEKMHGNSSRKNWPANDGRPTVPWPTRPPRFFPRKFVYRFLCGSENLK